MGVVQREACRLDLAWIRLDPVERMALIVHRIRDYLDLIRLPNVFTAAADAVAGYVYVGGTIEGWPTVVALVSASASLYAGGVALNDVCDMNRDMRERPERPIPSGRVSLRAARCLCGMLLAAGLGCAAWLSVRALLIASLLVVCIVLYHTAFKTSVLAPAFMGACRALNLTLAMSVAESLWTTAILVPSCLMWLYVSSLTLFARCEGGVSTRRRLVCGLAGMCTGTCGLSCLSWILDQSEPLQLWLVGVVTVLVGLAGWRAVRAPQPRSVQRAVKRLVFMIILFDACIVAAARGPAVTLAIAGMIAPAAALGRPFRVT
ncbi:MAG: UbiA family prenyltransferase [Phycisphaerae bacterium]